MAHPAALRLSDFDFILPRELIAQNPLPRRDDSRLLVVDRATGSFCHSQFKEFPRYLNAGDTIVLNNTRVRAARLRGTVGGRAVELLLVKRRGRNRYLVMAKPARRLVEGANIEGNGWRACCGASFAYANSIRLPEVVFLNAEDIESKLDEIGTMPLPPYIRRYAVAADRERYQTVFGLLPGAIAAPTAGLHFTEELLQSVRQQNVRLGYVTLHVGIGTFSPVREDDITRHSMHGEEYVVSDEAARLIQVTRRAGKRVCAVGTTVCRALETCSRGSGRQFQIIPGSGETEIFIHPPYVFKAVDMLLTNFHLPRSTLLMLVSAFAGRELMLAAYQEAVRKRYRFFSYGDAMLIV